MIEKTNSKVSTLSELPFYPLLFAIFVPVNLLAQNISLFSPAESVRAALLFLLAAAMWFAVINLFVRQRHSSAWLTTLLFVGIWVYQFSNAWRIAYALILLLSVVLVWRGWVSARFSTGLNLVMAAILLQPLYVLTSSVWLDEDSANLTGTSLFATAQPGVASPPNIVHILLDGYASRAVLSSVMDFDNAEFESQLEALGFTIAADARTPYNQTLLVMSAIYSGTYHSPDEPPFSGGDADHIKRALGGSVAGGPVKKKLTELGYRFLYTDPGFNFWQFGESDIVAAPPLGPFELTVYEQLLVDRTSLNLIPGLFNWAVGRPNFKSARLTELTRFSLTTDFYKDYPPPYVLYEHVVAPHPPFNIDRDGNATTRWKAFSDMADGGHATLGNPRRQQRYIEGYLEKLRYVNTEVLKQLQAMVADVPSPKIIMLHGDHGGGAYYLPDDPKLSCLNERYSPFLAVFTDDPQIRAAFAHIATERVNLVNLYRLIFDARFGTELGLAADRSWFNSWDSPRELIELSDEQISASCNVAAGS